jgi:dethiobiotin synthetase
MRRRAIFVAGTGTDVGKTYVASSLLRTLRAQGHRTLALKPVASGIGPIGSEDFACSDTARLLDAQDVAVTPDAVERCTPWRFAAPLSPDLAAAAENRPLPLADIIAFCGTRLVETQNDVAIVEGAGGIMSPIASDGLNLDLAAALDLPVLLISGTYLGAISHTLSALEVIEARGLRVLGVSVNETPCTATSPSATCEIIARFAPGAVLIPLGQNASVPQSLVDACLAL